MSQPRDTTTAPMSHEPATDAPTPDRGATTDARRPWIRPEIQSSRIFHGVVLAGFNPTFCGGGGS